MAARYWVTGGTSNWNSTTNWSTTSGGSSGASVPGTTDDAIFDGNSGIGNVIININTANIISADFTNFSGTTVFNATLNTRSIILGVSMSFNTTSGTPNLTMGGTCQYTSNGVTFPYRLSLGAASTTLTLNDNITVQDLHRITTGSNTLAINNNTLTILGNFSFTSTGIAVSSGTATIILGGNGVWSQTGTGPWRNNLIINTSGTITISGNVYYDSGTLTYISGDVNAYSSTLNIGALTNLNTFGIVWGTISQTQGGVITLLSDLYVENIISSPTATIPINSTINESVYVLKSLTNINTGTFGGTSTIFFVGDDVTWSSTNNGRFNSSMVISTKGKLKIGSNIRYGVSLDPTLRYEKGFVDFQNFNLLIQANCTLLNINNIIIRNIIITGGITVKMNEFFNGKPDKTTKISSSSTTNFIIQMLEGFEKISKYVEFDRMTLLGEGGLLILNNRVNGINNIGNIRFVNQHPNGISKRNKNLIQPMSFSVPNFLISDPALSK